MIELQAVVRIAFAEWRMHRLAGMETAAIDKELGDQSGNFAKMYGDNGDNFLREMLAFQAVGEKQNGIPLFQRYQAYLERSFARAMKAYFHLRTKSDLLNELPASVSLQAQPAAGAEVQTPPEKQAEPPNELPTAAEPARQEEASSPATTVKTAEKPNELSPAAESPATNAYTDSQQQTGPTLGTHRSTSNRS